MNLLQSSNLGPEWGIRGSLATLGVFLLLIAGLVGFLAHAEQGATERAAQRGLAAAEAERRQQCEREFPFRIWDSETKSCACCFARVRHSMSSWAVVPL